MVTKCSSRRRKNDNLTSRSTGKDYEIDKILHIVWVKFGEEGGVSQSTPLTMNLRMSDLRTSPNECFFLYIKKYLTT